MANINSWSWRDQCPIKLWPTKPRQMCHNSSRVRFSDCNTYNTIVVNQIVQPGHKCFRRSAHLRASRLMLMSPKFPIHTGIQDLQVDHIVFDSLHSQPLSIISGILAHDHHGITCIVAVSVALQQHLLHQKGST